MKSIIKKEYYSFMNAVKKNYILILILLGIFILTDIVYSFQVLYSSYLLRRIMQYLSEITGLILGIRFFYTLFFEIKKTKIKASNFLLFVFIPIILFSIVFLGRYIPSIIIKKFLVIILVFILFLLYFFMIPLFHIKLIKNINFLILYMKKYWYFFILLIAVETVIMTIGFVFVLLLSNLFGRELVIIKALFHSILPQIVFIEMSILVYKYRKKINKKIITIRKNLTKASS